MGNPIIHDLFDASKVWAAAYLGWVVTPDGVELVVRAVTSVAVCAYMVAKAVYAWKKLLKDDTTNSDEADT
jgi:hypothetical protein